MSRFNPFADNLPHAQVQAPRLLRLFNPMLVSGPIAIAALFALSLCALTVAPTYLPAFTPFVDPAMSTIVAAFLSVLLLWPLAEDGLDYAGVTLRGALCFFAAGLATPVAVLTYEWRAGGLHTAARLSTVLTEAAEAITMSAGLHLVVGALVAPLVALFTCRLAVR